jgi:hypothetical protein
MTLKLKSKVFKTISPHFSVLATTIITPQTWMQLVWHINLSKMLSLQIHQQIYYHATFSQYKFHN